MSYAGSLAHQIEVNELWSLDSWSISGSGLGWSAPTRSAL